MIRELSDLAEKNFASMAELGQREGQLEEKESRILKNLFLFSSSYVKDIMTPRTVVYALEKTMPVREYIEHHSENPFSRIPIFQTDRDHIIGYVLKNDILLAHAKGQEELQLFELKRAMLISHNDSTISELFELFVSRKEQVSLVVDEYGGLTGIVTMEDIVETLLGLEIVDEADLNEDMQVLARRLWEKRARTMGITILDPNEKEEDKGDR